jgi:ABC-type bacteriocin/lantibiotic exporter with double-glycine peptidase domain
MAYIVPNMKLIPQDQAMSCWYASAQMLINWRREITQSSEMGIIDPGEDSSSQAIYALDKGIQNSQIIAMAKRLGLVAVPPLSPTEEAIEDWLFSYGPLWVNGISHIVVIAGIRAGQVLVYDPSPVNKGHVSWRSLDTWYIGNAVDSRDTSNAVETVFLHCP